MVNYSFISTRKPEEFNVIFTRIFCKTSTDSNLDIFNGGEKKNRKKKKLFPNHENQPYHFSASVIQNLFKSLTHTLYLYEIPVHSLGKIILDNVKVPQRSPSDTMPKTCTYGLVCPRHIFS